MRIYIHLLARSWIDLIKHGCERIHCQLVYWLTIGIVGMHVI